MGGREGATCSIDVTPAEMQDEGTHLARTENLWVVRAVIATIGWDQVVFNTRLRGCNCVLKHGASTEALEHEVPG